MNRLDQIEARANAATEGPWAPWRDQDGALHMNGLLMVGNAAAVIPEGESWVEGVDVNPIAHTYTPEDREFIAHARTDVPALVAVARYALSQHSKDEAHNECGHCADSYGEDGWPCSTVREIHRLLGEDA